MSAAQDIQHISSYYRELEAAAKVRHVEESVTYVSPVNFTESMSTPRHRWFPYKEGFSPSFVRGFLSDYKADTQGTVFDPFSGVGTTAITAATEGHSAVGFDVSPLATFVARTKSLQLSKSGLERVDAAISSFAKAPLSEAVDPPDNETVLRYYEEDYLDAILRIKAFAASLDDDSVRDLFRLAILAVVEHFSTHRKAGNGVKRKTRLAYGFLDMSPADEVRFKVLELLTRYYEDMASSRKFASPEFLQTSAIEPEGFDSISHICAVVTSPPYANCFDYSKIYMQELWLGDFFRSKADQKRFRDSSVRSHVHSTWEDRNRTRGLEIVDKNISEILESQKLWSNKLAGMLSGYFQDLGRTLDLLKPKLEANAPVGFVVGNSFYGGIPIATDLLIGELGKRYGYALEEVVSFRKIIPSSQQFKRQEDRQFMRESLVVLRNAS